MARRAFSLIRAFCAFRVEACFVAAFVLMLLHDSVGVRRVVVHTTTASVVRHEIDRHQHLSDRHVSRERVRRESARPVRAATPPGPVQVAPRRTIRKVRTAEPVRHAPRVHVAPRSPHALPVELAPMVHAAPRPAKVVSIEPATEIRAPAPNGGSAAGGTRTSDGGVHILVPGTAAATF